jgi:hyperosmotically inducible periplasmic protein
MRFISRFLFTALLSFTLATGCTALTGKSAGTNIDDTTITASVKTNLAAERGMQTLTSVDVDTNRGVVSLNGVVESATAKDRAAAIARQTNGVHKVINNLQVVSVR